MGASRSRLLSRPRVGGMGLDAGHQHRQSYGAGSHRIRCHDHRWLTVRRTGLRNVLPATGQRGATQVPHQRPRLPTHPHRRNHLPHHRSLITESGDVRRVKNSGNRALQRLAGRRLLASQWKEAPPAPPSPPAPPPGEGSPPSSPMPAWPPQAPYPPSWPPQPPFAPYEPSAGPNAFLWVLLIVSLAVVVVAPVVEILIICDLGKERPKVSAGGDL
mmetsp:Transcript_2519/g.7267  ORF Transcript_2519/g.7267 Transcript_2519/m.7267 type:complete len:216 (-) Transcript_2519:309-956(-)